MKAPEKVKSGLDKKFHKVVSTPASFAFFAAIHDFIKHIELNASLSKHLSHRMQLNRERNIQGKYNYLKQIYQGFEDIGATADVDLGHARYVALRELKGIKNNDLSENNAFWKKRDLFRKLTGEIYERLNPVKTA